MNKSYHNAKANNYRDYLSTDPDDAGLRVRLSGDLLMVYNTARPIEFDRKRSKERSSIVRFSEGCATRMARYLRESVAEYTNMVTLTYPSEYPIDGRVIKQHLRVFLQRVKRLAESNGRMQSSSFWFLEFQARGAPHFHIFTTEFVPHFWIATTWYDIVGSGDQSHLKAGTRIEKLKAGKKGVIVYAKKYARKQEQKEVPENYQNVGRFWGIHGVKKVLAADVTFYKDDLRKNDVKRLQSTLFLAIEEQVANGSLVCVRRSFGFRCFRYDKALCSVDLHELITSCNVKMKEVSYMFEGAELSTSKMDHGIDTFSGEYVYGGRLYQLRKWGELNARA
jgi:hypothetical protein